MNDRIMKLVEAGKNKVNMRNVKPCPFCGGRHIICDFWPCVDGDVKVRVWCKTCTARYEFFDGGKRFGKKTAIRHAKLLWNRRIQPYEIDMRNVSSDTLHFRRA